MSKFCLLPLRENSILRWEEGTVTPASNLLWLWQIEYILFSLHFLLASCEFLVFTNSAAHSYAFVLMFCSKCSCMLMCCFFEVILSFVSLYSKIFKKQTFSHFWHSFPPIKSFPPFFQSHVLPAAFVDTVELGAFGHLMWCLTYCFPLPECLMWEDRGLSGRNGFTALKEWPPSFSVWRWVTTTWF